MLRGDRIRLPGGLILAEKARIDLAEFASQPVGMSEAAILNQRARRPFGASEVWLRRAAQARRIARMLSVADAAILDAYAIECEAEARSEGEKLRNGAERRWPRRPADGQTPA